MRRKSEDEGLDLLFLSMHYRPEPCDTRTSALAQEFVRRGHRSRVLTSFPNYPFGKVYEGYRQRPWMREEIEGVDVVRLPMLPDHSKSVKRRALSYASFAASASLFGPVLAGKPDLIWIHHPPITTGLAGWLVSVFKGAPFIYEIHDLWPETLMSTGMVAESRVTRMIRKTCDFLHDWAAAVVVTSPGMKRHLVAQGLADHKIHVIPQWADEEALKPIQIDPAFGSEYGLVDHFNLMFTGNVGAAQDLETVIEAAAILRSMPEVQFVIVGAGVELDRLRAKCSELGLMNVRFLGQISRDEMPRVLAWADALLVTLRDDPLFAITVPSKTQTYLHAGKPILCGVAGDTADIVSRSQAGFSFSPGDPQALAAAVHLLLALPEDQRERMGERGRRSYELEFSKAALMGRYEELFTKIARPQRIAEGAHRPVTVPDIKKAA